MKKYLISILSILFLLLGISSVLAQSTPSVPEAPTNVSAVMGDGQATISFTPSPDVDGAPIEAYRVVSVPDSYKMTGSSSPIIITGLTNGVSYSFYVTAINSAGSSVPSSPTNVIIPGSVSTSTPPVNNPNTANKPPKKSSGVRPVSNIPSSATSTSSKTNSASTSTSPAQNVSTSSASTSITSNVVENISSSSKALVENENNSEVSVSSSFTQAIKKQTAVVAQVTQEIVVNTKEYVNTPTGSAVTKTVTTVSALGSGLAALSTSFASPLAIPEMFLIPLRIWGLLLTTFGLKKRNRSWGTVYDSVTKQPIDPAYVTLRDMSGKEVASSITDLDGRYGFLVGPGKYIIEAQKTNYSYPSAKLAGKESDEMYNHLYFGGEIEVPEGGLVINKNIPLDPLRFDWNEFTKGKNKLMSFYSKREVILKKLSDISFEFGLIVAVLALLFAPEPYNYGIVILYLIILGFKIMGIKTKTFGEISELTDNSPLSFAIVKVFSEDWSVEIVKKVADQYGRYFCLLPVGKYHVKIDKKNSDETYSEVFESPVLDIKDGVLNKNFTI